MCKKWDKLTRYLTFGDRQQRCGECYPAIRPGRKNWLFSASVKGVKASVNLYSLIEAAKANGLEPYAHLRHLFTELPKVETLETIEALLPGNFGKDQISTG